MRSNTYKGQRGVLAGLCSVFQADRGLFPSGPYKAKLVDSSQKPGIRGLPAECRALKVILSGFPRGSGLINLTIPYHVQ